MTKKVQATIKFNGSPEQEKLLRQKLDELKNIDGPLMPALAFAQELYGYLPIEVQKIVSEELSIPLEHIYGVVTFYSQFTLSPKGEYQISVCMGTACYVKGAGDVLNRVQEILHISPGECTEDGLFSLDATRCLGCCGLAPVMTINEDVYGNLTKNEVKGILKKYMKDE